MRFNNYTCNLMANLPELKKLLIAHCTALLVQRITVSETAMKNAQESANSEDKSSAGDKYETSRAMGHLDRDMNAKQLLVAKQDSLCEFELEPNSTIYIFGGEPFLEERFIDWNFVSSDKKLLAAARENWVNQTFPKVPGETTFVPLPQLKK